MNVQIKVPLFLRHLTGNATVVNTSGKTVGECLRQFAEQFPETRSRLFDENGDLLSDIEVFINEASAFPGELIKTVKDGDRIQILQVIIGG